MPPAPLRSESDISPSSSDNSSNTDAGEAPAAAKTRWSRAWSIIKWTLTAALLALVLSRLPLAELSRRLGQIGPTEVLLLTAISTLQVALSVARWWRLLHRLGERVPYSSTFGDTCVGFLYNFLLPGSVGGDVVRAIRMRARLRVPHHAWASSIFERIVGLFAMAAVASIATVIGVDASVTLPPWITYATFGLTASLAATFVFASLPFRLLVRLIGRHLPEAARADLVGIGEDLSGPLAKLSIRGEAFAWSIAYQATSLVFVMTCASALGAPGHERAIIIGVPMIYVLSLLPITVGGHGLREGLYVGILGALGMPGEVALGLSGAFVVSSIVFSGVGALVMVLERPKSQDGASAPRP